MADQFQSGVGQSAVEFDDSQEAGSVEGRLSLVRTLVADVVRSDESTYTKDITFDGKIWRVTVESIA